MTGKIQKAKKLRKRGPGKTKTNKTKRKGGEEKRKGIDKRKNERKTHEQTNKCIIRS